MKLLWTIPFLIPSPAVPHDFWTTGEPVPEWVKATCCGKADAHHIAADAVHATRQGFVIEGIDTVVPYDRVLPSQDGEYWGFWDEAFLPAPPVYCFFAPTMTY